MDNYRILRKRREKVIQGIHEDQYVIAEGCCLFHDIDEVKNFTNSDDDILNI